MGVTVVTSAGNINVNTSQQILAPSGWDKQIAEYGRGYNYPISSQLVSYRNGDEAYIESNVFAPIRVENSLKVQNSLTDFYTLGNTNSFGNLLRLTDELGTQVFANDYMVDNYTGLGYKKTRISVGAGITWNDNVDNSLGSDFGGANEFIGFTDWFLTSSNQLITLGDVNINSFVNSIFAVSNNLDSSTTPIHSTTTYLKLTYSNKTVSSPNKVNQYGYYVYCRKHF